MSKFIRRVRGAQAEGAASLGLVKVTLASARAAYEAGEDVLIVGNNVATFHFFGGWRLAHWFHGRNQPKVERGAEFDRYRNSFEAYLERELGRRAAFFCIEPTRSERGISIGEAGSHFTRQITLVNPSDRSWTRRDYVLWFGGCGVTYLRVWAGW